jgi:hypothetical protein
MLGEDFDRHLEKALQKVDDTVNEELGRQFVQLGDSLQDFLWDLFNYPLERPWRQSLAIFAEHWEDRGLRLMPVTLDAISSLIAEELGDSADAGDGDDSDAWEPDASMAIYLAAAPRRGAGKHTPKRAGGRTANSETSKAFPHGKRVPAGEWITGKEGNGILKLANPIELADGKKVTRIEFKDGLPIFDKWALKGEDVFIAITGDHQFDRAQALKAWQTKTGKTALAIDYVFHHDGHVREIRTHRGQQVFIARMQPIPEILNKKAGHFGSARMARRYTLDPDVAREVNEIALQGKGPLARRARRKAGSKIAKKAAKLGRAIPIIGGVLDVVYFADDVEAHGLGGAIIRATPLLGDIVSAYDVGKAVADEIAANAKHVQDQAYLDTNEPVQAAQAAAGRATAEAFNQIAKTLRITKEYIQPQEVIDAIADPLREFYEEAFSAYMQAQRGKGVRYPPGTTPAQAAREPALEMRLWMAREKLESSLKNKLQQPVRSHEPLG